MRSLAQWEPPEHRFLVATSSEAGYSDRSAARRRDEGTESESRRRAPSTRSRLPVYDPAMATATMSPRPSASRRAPAVRALAATAKKKSTAGVAGAESLIALVLRRKQRITEDFFDIGKALRELFRHKLYLTLGYDPFEAMLESRRLLGATQGRKLIALVDAYTRALALGLEKTFAVIAYAAATPAHESAAVARRNGDRGEAVRGTLREASIA
jgi:hypothetical protein